MAASDNTTPTFPPDPLPPILLGGSVNVFAGASGTGKTALLAGWAVALRDKTPICGYLPGQIRKIYVISADRSYIQSTKLWFALAGWGDIPAYSLQDDLGFNLARLRKRSDRVSILQHCIDTLSVEPWSVVIVDPLGLFLGGNLLDYDTCLVACSEIRRICQRRQFTILGLAHASKQIADPKRRYLRLQDRIAGSTAIFGYSDTQIYLAAPEELSTPKHPIDHYTLYWNPHHSPSETFALQRTSEGLFGPAEKIIDARPTNALTQLERAASIMEWITDLPGGTNYGDLASLVLRHPTLNCTNDRMLRRWIAALIDAGMIERVGHGSYKQVRLS